MRLKIVHIFISKVNVCILTITQFRVANSVPFNWYKYIIRCILISFTCIGLHCAEKIELDRWNWLVSHGIIQDVTPFDENELMRNMYISEYCKQIKLGYEEIISGSDIGWPAPPLSTGVKTVDSINDKVFYALYIKGKHIRTIIEEVFLIYLKEKYLLKDPIEISLCGDKKMLVRTSGDNLALIDAVGIKNISPTR